MQFFKILVPTQIEEYHMLKELNGTLRNYLNFIIACCLKWGMISPVVMARLKTQIVKCMCVWVTLIVPPHWVVFTCTTNYLSNSFTQGD